MKVRELHIFNDNNILFKKGDVGFFPLLSILK